MSEAENDARNNMKDLQKNLGLVQSAMTWCRPLLRLHEELSPATEIMNQVSQLTAQHKRLQSEVEELQAGIVASQGQRDTAIQQAKDQGHAVKQATANAKEEINRQQDESKAMIASQKQNADAEMKRMAAKVKTIDAAAFTRQGEADRTHAEWRVKADQEIKEAEKRLDGLRHAAKGIQSKVATLTL